MKTRFEINWFALNWESKIIVKVVIVDPFWTGFSYLVDFTAVFHKLIHQAADFLERNILQLSFDPPVRALG